MDGPPREVIDRPTEVTVPVPQHEPGIVGCRGERTEQRDERQRVGLFEPFIRREPLAPSGADRLPVLVVELVPVIDERLELDLGMDRLAAGLGDLRPAQRSALLDRSTEEATGGVQQTGIPLEPAGNDEPDDRRKLPTLIQPRIEPVGRFDSRLEAEGGVEAGRYPRPDATDAASDKLSSTGSV